MKILCTGGCGYLGSALVKRLVDLGHAVDIIDDLSRGKRENLTDIFGDPEWVGSFYQHDMKNPLQFPLVYDVVFDLAARVYGITRLYDDEPSFLRENTLILLNTLECVKNAVKHYFYVSSSCVYHFDGCPTPHKEEHANVIPRTGYDISKRFGEEIVRIYAEKHGFKYTVIRPFNVYAAGEGEEAPHVITDFFNRILEETKNPTGTFWILGSGEQTRSFTYLEDFVDGLILLMDAGSEGVFNVGSDEETRVIDLLRMAMNTAGLDYDRYEVERRKPFKEDVQRRNPDVSKMKALGWTPKHSLEQGLKETWATIKKSE